MIVGIHEQTILQDVYAQLIALPPHDHARGQILEKMCVQTTAEII